MLGQSAPVSSLTAFTDDLRALKARVAELERLLSTVPLVQRGTRTATTDAAGFIEQVFATPYAIAPSVVATRLGTSTADLAVQVHSVSTTGFFVRLKNDGVTLASTTATFMWSAGPNT